MKTRTDRDISRRMREMLTGDKLFVSEGFMTAVKSELTRLLENYFCMSSPINVSIEREQDGAAFEVRVSFAATQLKKFDTTLDIKRF